MIRILFAHLFFLNFNSHTRVDLHFIVGIQINGEWNSIIQMCICTYYVIYTKPNKHCNNGTLASVCLALVEVFVLRSLSWYLEHSTYSYVCVYVWWSSGTQFSFLDFFVRQIDTDVAITRHELPHFIAYAHITRTMLIRSNNKFTYNILHKFI